MCTPTVAATIATTAAIAGTAAAGAVATKALTKKPDIPKITPPDLAAEEKRKQARLLQKQIAGAPGPGRRETIVAGATTGAGTSALKQKTGQ